MAATRYLLRNLRLVNEGEIIETDLLLEDGRFAKIDGQISASGATELDCTGLTALPGLIDDQVHFREPGLTDKAEIATESRAAVAGGVTTFMDMPNVKPPSLTQALLAERYALAAQKSLANYSFYMGVSNDNYDEVVQTDPQNVCGIKVFLGASTGNLLVDDEHTLSKLFANAPCLIATHCESEAHIQANLQKAKDQYGEAIPMDQHPVIRDTEACYASSFWAVEMAKRYGTRLHVLHISTAKELALFRNDISTKAKRITAEACLHHLWFTDADYEALGARIKWNPAVKTEDDREAIWDAVRDGRIDVIATDHAPHTWAEKQNPYLSCPSGGPLVQHLLPGLLACHQQGRISLERIALKTAHAVADCFGIKDRGYVREGYWADLVLVDLNSPWTVAQDNILAKCGWSPFEGTTFPSQVKYTFVSGELAYADGKLHDQVRGKRLEFSR